MKIHFALSSDENYLPFLGTALSSLLENNKEFKKITIHILSNSISTENQTRLKTFVNSYKRDCIIYDMSNIEELLGGLKVETIAISSYSRLFLTEILPKEVDKIIYLDCDSLIVSSYKKLWELDIEDYLVAGVEDIVPLNFKTSLNLEKDTRFINAGMMLMNIKKLREENWMLKIRDFIKGFSEEIPHHDQGVVNALFHDKILILDPKYNCMTPFFLMSSNELVKLYDLNDYYNDIELAEAIDNPVFVHLTPSFLKRPWVKGSRHPMVEKYLFYLSKTPWSDFKLQEDKRKLKIKFVAFLFRVLPFKLFYLILRLIKK